MFEQLLDKILRLLRLRSGHGFNARKEKILPEHWQAGDGNLAGTAEVIRLDGQWDDYLPEGEPQKRRIESMNCTNYGTLNALEILAKAKYKVDKNWSERYMGVLSGTTRGGNSPHRVGETIRKYGNIPDFLLPYTSKITSWSQYYSPKPMEQTYITEGKTWLERWQFAHKWIYCSVNSLKEALKYSPLGASVKAWYRTNEGIYYRPQGSKDNHWCVIYGYVDGQYWKVFDSYEPYLKRLAWSSIPQFAKKYTLIQLKEDMPVQTIKKKNSPEIYIVSGTNSKELRWIGGWESYKAGLDAGWLKPFVEVDNLDDYEIKSEIWGIIK